MFTQNENVRQLESAREAREKLREIQEQITSKESLQARLQDEFSKVDKNINRYIYFIFIFIDYVFM